jgi:hypothetical protein
MDVLSHACLGALLGEVVVGSAAASPAVHRRTVAWAAVMGAAPGLLQILLHVTGTPRFVPPTQSVVVGLAVVLPLCRAFALPLAAPAAWFFALAVDVVTGHGAALHGTGEVTSLAPLWPLPWSVVGLLESERWSWAGNTAAAVASAAAWWRVRTILGRRRRSR